MKKLINPLMAAALVVFAVGCKKVESIHVSPSATTLTEAGQVVALQATALTKDGEPVEKVEFTFASSDPGVASVDATGKVTAVKSGTATITAKGNEKSGATSVEVIIPAAVVLKNAPTTLTGLGSQAAVEAEVQDDANRPVKDAKVEFASADAKIVEVNGNTLVAKGLGTTAVTATSGKLEQRFEVTVKLPDVAELAFDTVPASLKVGDSTPLAVVAKAADGGVIQGASFTFATSDEKIATVDATGNVTAVKKGAVTITATSGSKTAEAKLTVDKK